MQIPATVSNIDDEAIMNGDGWVYFLELEEAVPGLWLFMEQDTKYGWSEALKSWLYVSPGSLAAGSGWVMTLQGLESGKTATPIPTQ